MAGTKKTTRRGNNQAASGWIKKDRRLAIYLRDDFRCLYCLRDLRDAAPFDISLDHVKPESDGGGNHEKIGRKPPPSGGGGSPSPLDW